MTGTFEALHSKCSNRGNCQGPGCKVRRNYNYSSAAPRVKDRPTKAERRLAKRIEAFESHGANPVAGRNPSNSSGQGHDMLRPGSKNVRNG